MKMRDLTRHQKKEYYSKLSDHFNYLYYDPNRLSQSSKLRIILDFDVTDKLSAKIYKDSKLSALRNGMLRTFNTIDHMDISRERKENTINDLIDIYYEMYQDLYMKITRCMYETKSEVDPKVNEDAYVYVTRLKTRKIKHERK